MHCRSRQILKSTRLDVSAGLRLRSKVDRPQQSQHRLAASNAQLFAVANECDELRDSSSGERINDVFQFRSDSQAYIGSGKMEPQSNGAKPPAALSLSPCH